MKSPRQLTAEALMRVERDKSWSNLALDSLIKKNGLQARDAGFVSALFYGVLERLITLDACVAANCARAPDKLDAAVRAILRLTLYQLIYMDSIPVYAAVNEAVELTRKMRVPGASGFVNAVLQAFLRGGKIIPLPGAPPEKRLGVEYSVHESIARLWLQSYGHEKTEEILKASFGRPPVYIRVNTLKTTAGELVGMLEESGVKAERDDTLPNCLAISGHGAVGDMDAYKRGFFHVQDKSSQLCVEALDIEPGQSILDMCAAPGGKSFTIAQEMGDSRLVSAELHEKRVLLMEKGANRLGIRSMECVHADMTEHQPGLGEFDRVLCDVPCSGYGVIRRKPEIRYKPLEDFSEIARLQYKILTAASQYLRKGGRLVYSACTLNPAENGDIAARFLSEHPSFAPAALPGALNAGDGYEKLITGESGGDCFYVASFTRITADG